MGSLIFIIHIFSVCIVVVRGYRIFSRNFSFGTGISAYQTEGSWDRYGKSENIWDHWIHTDPTRIANNDTADEACDAYNYPSSDIAAAYQLEVHHYRFSIPWTRILPSGFSDGINVKAIIHYQKILSYLKLVGITPVATLYYHDLPQSLQDIGGWTNPDMVKYFVDYARVCFQSFPGVKYWITFNDPRAICRKGYGDGSFAPGMASDGVGEYLCAYNVLKAHAAVYHLYKEEFQKLDGKVSIALDLKWSEPATSKDTDAVERRNAFEFGLYANPIYKGNWPAGVVERIAYRSKNENFTRSRLPEFTKEEIDSINGTADFMAINLYDANIVEDTDEDKFGDPSYSKDMKAKVYLDPSWKLAVNGQPIVPLCARKALVWLSSTYNNPEIFITENGVPDPETKEDTTRIDYFRDYLNAILDAILEDGVNVIGYTAWSLYDSFEWTDGYSYRFGIFYVDFDLDKRPTWDKASFEFYLRVTRKFTIPASDTTTTTITTTTTSSPTTTTTTTTSTTIDDPGSAARYSLSLGLLLINMFLFQLLS